MTEAKLTWFASMEGKVQEAIRVAREIAAGEENIQSFYHVGCIIQQLLEDGQLPTHLVSRVAAESGLTKRGVQSASRFAKKYSPNQAKQLTSGSFRVTWRWLASKLSYDPKELILAYVTSSTPTEFPSKLEAIVSKRRPPEELEEASYPQGSARASQPATTLKKSSPNMVAAFMAMNGLICDAGSAMSKAA